MHDDSSIQNRPCKPVSDDATFVQRLSICAEGADSGKLCQGKQEYDSTRPILGIATGATARVLIVDDDRELCQMLGEYLDAEHFEVKSVHDGGDALTLQNRTTSNCHIGCDAAERQRLRRSAQARRHL